MLLYRSTFFTFSSTINNILLYFYNMEIFDPQKYEDGIIQLEHGGYNAQILHDVSILFIEYIYPLSKSPGF